MKAKIIVHNQVSLNGAYLGFNVDMEKYYKALNAYKPDLILTGSNTALQGIEMFNEIIPEEVEDDFRKPAIEKKDKRPYWVVPDSEGKLKDLLHVYRNSGYCKDIIVLISKNTSEEYKQYLHERHYDFVISGYLKVDLRSALDTVEERYKPKTIVTDCGSKLIKRLFKLGLIGQVSLIVSPVITRNKYAGLLTNLDIPRNIELKRTKIESLDDDLIHITYTVI
jgi:2,5-diamino-6-(ribosylamino)-4(3H)-pyrimidinone 5'-phosphate reductase